MSIPYTLSEKTTRKYSTEHAKTAAKAILSERGIESVCVNALRTHSGGLMTLPELNDLVEDVITDSVYYAA